MCGISGLISKDKINHNNFKKFTKAQSHRGPDGYKIFKISNHVYLGHNLLSIMDDKNVSRQPYQFNNKILTFNGAIYNFVEIKNFLVKKKL